MNDDAKTVATLGGLLTLVVCIIGPILLFGCPKYKVWEQGLDGEAELNRATFSKQVAVQEATAKMESAKMLAQAEVERAKGVAEANKIIGDSLKGNDAYLRYLWVNGMTSGNREVIYVPTEANLPILEAGRHNAAPAPQK